MKTQSAALALHRASGTTTLAHCWRIERQDGQIFCFTSSDQDIVFEGRRYLAATGFTPSAMQASADLSVPNLEVTGMLDSATITEADLLAGRWDGAAVEIFELNWADVSQGKMILRVGTLGNVSAGRVAFQAELRGLSQQLQQPVGSVYAAACDANLGDARCGVDLAALSVATSVTSASADQRSFSASTLGQADDYFGGGVVTWTTGANAGLKMEVRSFAAGAVALVQRMPYSITVGDTLAVVPGCRKRCDEDCSDKFDNVINFRGFPHVPQNDKVLGNGGLS